MSEVTFTVLGFYEDSGQSFAMHVQAEDGTDAMRKVAEAHVKSDNGEACTLLAAICGTLHDRSEVMEGHERDFGAMTFAGESVVDAKTYLTNFEVDEPLILDAKTHLDIMDIDRAVDAANDAAWKSLEQQGDKE